MLFLQNLFGYGLDVKPVAGLAPLWSLAVEEQFYLVLPLLVASLNLRKFKTTLLLSIAIGILLKSWHQRGESLDGFLLYTNPTPIWFRMQYLALGGLLAIEGIRWRHFLGVFAYWLIVASIVAGLVGIIEASVGFLLFVAVKRCVDMCPVIRNPFWLGG